MIALFNKRTVVGGSRELVWARISDCNGNSLTDVDVSMTILPDGQHPTTVDWKTPDKVTHSGRIIRSALLFNAPIPPSGQRLSFSVYARATDSPEDIWVHCGQFTVI